MAATRPWTMAFIASPGGRYSEPLGFALDLEQSAHEDLHLLEDVDAFGPPSLSVKSFKSGRTSNQVAAILHVRWQTPARPSALPMPPTAPRFLVPLPAAPCCTFFGPDRSSSS